MCIEIFFSRYNRALQNMQHWFTKIKISQCNMSDFRCQFITTARANYHFNAPISRIRCIHMYACLLYFMHNDVWTVAYFFIYCFRYFYILHGGYYTKGLVHNFSRKILGLGLLHHWPNCRHKYGIELVLSPFIIHMPFGTLYFYLYSILFDLTFTQISRNLLTVHPDKEDLYN